jgi:hypothetical protein
MVNMNALRDDETQKRGFVAIAYNVGRDHTKGTLAHWIEFGAFLDSLLTHIQFVLR